MELKLSSNFSGKPVSVVVPTEKVIKVFWPKDESSVDVPKQLIGFHYVVLKKNTL